MVLVCCCVVVVVVFVVFESVTAAAAPCESENVAVVVDAVVAVVASGESGKVQPFMITFARTRRLVLDGNPRCGCRPSRGPTTSK